jgi:hypothetical protein
MSASLIGHSGSRRHDVAGDFDLLSGQPLDLDSMLPGRALVAFEPGARKPMEWAPHAAAPPSSVMNLRRRITR